MGWTVGHWRGKSDWRDVEGRCWRIAAEEIVHHWTIAHTSQPSQKTFRIKQKLAKKARQNRPIPSGSV